MTKWHKGPPPSIGWWPAGITKQIDLLRWWNGEYWSVPVWCRSDERDAGRSAAYYADSGQDKIRWTERWWK